MTAAVLITATLFAAPARTFEAEAAAGDAAGWEVFADPTASGGAYAAVPSDPAVMPGVGAEPKEDGDAGGLAFTFELGEPATVRAYVLLKRHPTPHATEEYDRSLRVRWDGGPWADWTIENLGEVFWNWNAHDFPGWAGRRDRQPRHAGRFGPVPLWDVPLTAGRHTLEIGRRDAGVAIDRVVIATDPAYRPPFDDSRRGVVFHEGFEDDFGHWLWETISTGETEISTNHARAGDASARVELNFRGDTSHREELMLHGIAGRDTERWVAFSMLLPKGGDEDWAVDSKSNDILFQIHAFPDPDGTWVVPPISMNSSDGDWMIFLAVDADPTLVDGEYDFIGDVWRAPYETGVWTDWVYHFKFDHRRAGSEDDRPNGFLEVWKDGEQVLDRHGIQLGQNDVGASNFKTGVYKTRWRQHRDAETDVSRRVLYVDEIRIGDAAATFDDFRLPPKPPADTDAGTVRRPIVPQSDIELSTTFGEHRPVGNLIRYAEGRDFKKQEVAAAGSTLMNDVDERFQWLSGKGETSGELRFEFGGPRSLDALLLWPYPSWDATLSFPFAESADFRKGGRPDVEAANRSLREFTVTLLGADGGTLYESPPFTAGKAPADDPRIAAQTFEFGRAVPGVHAAVIRVSSNHGGLRTGASAVAWRTAR